MSSSRRAVGRASPAAAATSVSDIAAVVGVEAGEDVEAAGQRLDEVRPGAAPRHLPSVVRPSPSLALISGRARRSSPPARFDSST